MTKEHQKETEHLKEKHLPQKDTEKHVEKEHKKKLVPDAGDKIKTVPESQATDRTETVPGINEGKVARYGQK